MFSDSLVLDFCGQRGGPRSQGNPFPASCPCYRQRETNLYPVLAIISSDLLLRPLTPMHYVIRHIAVDDAKFWRDTLNPVELVRLLIKQATSDSVDFQLLKR